jgi:hypothetical protein
LFSFGKSLMAMTGFVSNRLFAARDAGYFKLSSAAQPLLHTWSLSVEEQFYLLFPAALVLLRRFKRHESTCLLFAIAASFVFSVWGAVHQPVETFYLLAPRAWELVIGALLALRPMPQLNNRVGRELLAFAGLALIVYAVTAFDKLTSLPGFHALIPCMGACLILYTGENRDSYTKTLLSFRPLVYIGVISYSLYLWHWPLIVFSRYFVLVSLNTKQKAVVLLASLLAAFISFEFIESPFRGKASDISKRQIYGFCVAASLFSMALGFMIYSSNGFPQRYHPKLRETIESNLERKSDFDSGCASYKAEVHKLADVESCQVGRTASNNILFWGDSQVQQLLPLVKKMHDDGKLLGKGAILAVEPGCPVAERMNSIVDTGYHCDQFAHFAAIRTRQDDIDTLFMGFSLWWTWAPDSVCLTSDGRCLRKLTSREAFQYFLDELSLRIRELRAAGKHVIVAVPFPAYDRSIPDLEIHNAVFGPLIGASKPRDLYPPGMREQVVSTAKSAGADIFDARQSLCQNRKCIYQIDGVSIYKDDSHLAATPIGILEDNLFKALSGDSRTTLTPAGAGMQLSAYASH